VVATAGDLNTSWRLTMTALGAALPHHLNRTAFIANRMHKAAR
jgi:hypothetical protein